MDTKKPIAALFDLDGVILDTESQYSIYWKEQGQKYKPDIPHFEQKIKGNTMKVILEYFKDQPGVPELVTQGLNDFETQMNYHFISGAEDFIKELHNHGVKTAIVTSSNELKMACVYKAHPHFKELFDRILTADMFKSSKPDPDCYLLGASLFETIPENCIVFEDSFNGLEAGNRAGMTVIGLSTTNSREEICNKSHYVIPDFQGFTFEKMHAIMKDFNKKP